MDVIYRLSDSPGKDRPTWFSKPRCFDNFLDAFGAGMLHLVIDGMDAETYVEVATQRWSAVHVERINEGHGGRAARYAFEYAMALPGDGPIYFVEDDYLHVAGGHLLLEGLQRFDYVTGYDHPDRYVQDSPNPFCLEGGSELTRVYRTESTHWRLANSTTMTFATRLSTLRKDWPIIRGNLYTPAPRDFAMWQELLWSGLNAKPRRRLATAVPGFCTHCESRWLAPGVDWENL